jgi:uncharacterized lipoprotein YmbA
MKTMWTLCLTALALAACTTTPPVKYYTLNALHRTAGGVVTAPEITVSISTVAIPDMLDRPQIVTRTDENRVNISDSHRWAGSLKEDLTRVLVENLNTLLAADQIRVGTKETAPDPAYHLIVHINRLEGGLGGTVKVDANWTIRHRKAKEVLASKDVLIEQVVGSGAYDALVAAQSRAIGVLSQEISKGIRDLLKSAGRG